LVQSSSKFVEALRHKNNAKKQNLKLSAVKTKNEWRTFKMIFYQRLSANNYCSYYQSTTKVVRNTLI